MERKDLLGMTIEELKQFAVELGEAPFRGRQLFRWIHKGERDFSAMTDFSEKLREKLQEAAFIDGVQVEKIQHDKKDGTRKFRQCSGRCFHEIQLRQLSVCLIPGGMQDGMCILRVSSSRSGPRSYSRRNAVSSI